MSQAHPRRYRPRPHLPVNLDSAGDALRWPRRQGSLVGRGCADSRQRRRERGRSFPVHLLADVGRDLCVALPFEELGLLNKRLMASFPPRQPSSTSTYYFGRTRFASSSSALPRALMN